MKEKVWEELTKLNSVLGKYEKDKLLKLIGVKLKHCLFLLKIFNHRRSGLDQKIILPLLFIWLMLLFLKKRTRLHLNVKSGVV